MSLTTRAFAAALGVVPETVRRWVKAGQISPAGRTPGGQLRFGEEQVGEALRGGTERAQDIAAHVLASRAKLRRKWSRTA